MNPFWNREERRPRAFWRIFAELLLRLGLLIGLVHLLRLGALTLGLPVPTDPGWKAFLHSFSPDRPTSQPLIQGVEMAASLLSALVATRLLDHRPLARLGFSLRARQWWLDLAFGLAAGVLAIGGILLCQLALGQVRFVGWFLPVAGGSSLSSWLAWGLAACLFNSLEEEVSDGRAYLILNATEGLSGTRLGPRGALLTAALLGSTMFGLAHYPGNGLAVALGTGLFGALLAVSYLLTGELAIAIGLHVTWNFAQINLVNLSENPEAPIPTILAVRAPGGASPEASALDLVGVGLGLALTLAWVRLTRGSLALSGALLPRPD